MNYFITGTETPKFVTEREQCIMDKCLVKINELEQTIEELERIYDNKSL